MKAKAADEIGVNLEVVKMPSSIIQSELVSKVEELNSDSSVHGIIVQV